jgi:Leucine-rich repeat (LRR) protein
MIYLKILVIFKMDKLEKDLLFLLATELSLPDLLNFCQTSKKINTLLCNNIWSYKLFKEYPDWKEFEYNKSLKEIYINLYKLQALNEKLNLDYSLLNLYKAQSIYLKEIHSNNIKQIPKEIGLLYNLRRLDLNDNKIKRIPKEIGQLHNLIRLNLNNNKIKKIPKEIGQLNNLEQLYLNHNKIKEIPKEIGKLHNLQYIGLNHNKIKKIPKEIGQLHISKIWLKNNKIKKTPKFLHIKHISI